MNTTRTILHFDGLYCADCAGKIEARAAQLPGVTAANLNFAAQTLTLEVGDQSALARLAREATEIALAIEPDIKVTVDGASVDKDAVHESPAWKEWLSLLIGAALFLMVLVFKLGQPFGLILYLLSFLLIGGEVLLRALKNILRGQVFDENFLMSLATIGAFAVGDYAEAVAVMLFYQLGEAAQNLAVRRSRRSIAALMDLRPEMAHLLQDGQLKTVAPEEVRVGELIVVKPGERVPLDGTVREGVSVLDTSALTGESLPQEVARGSGVLSGAINKNGVLTIQVTKEFGESTVSKFLELVQNASAKKAPTENFITKFARVYTPIVVFAAVALALLPPLFVPGAQFSDWLHRALIFLVVSCPCALVISIPLSFFGGIGGASRNGILIKGGNFLEALTRVDTMVFDKTGTVTKGVFEVTNVVALNGWTEEDVLKIAAQAEGFSNHPIALSIQKAGNAELSGESLSSPEELPGLGIRVCVDGRQVLAGNSKLMEAAGVSFNPVALTGSIVYVVVDSVLAGVIVVSDVLKEDSVQALQDLKALGVRKTVMLTGDIKATGDAVAAALGMDAVYSELLPQQKLERMEDLAREKGGKGTLVFVGDGVNDAPVLAGADVGIAMGALGADAAIEAADVVLMTDEPSKLVTAIKIARKTRAIVLQNIVLALGVKAVILVLSALGIATMWEAVFGDVGVALIAILNAMRAMRRQ